jgi:hypothetical protein
MKPSPDDKNGDAKLCNELRFNANHGPYVTKVSADLQHAAADRIDALSVASSATARRDGHSALRVKDWKMETFDPHPETAPSSSVESRKALLYAMAERFTEAANADYKTDHGKSMAAAYRTAAQACQLEADHPTIPHGVSSAIAPLTVETGDGIVPAVAVSARWLAHIHEWHRLGIDGACGQCCGTEGVAGWVCYYHRAKALIVATDGGATK